MDDITISPFISALPKVELHIHIEGTLQPALRWKLAQRNSITLQFKGQIYGTYEELLRSYNVTYNHRPEQGGRKDVPTFLEAYFAGCKRPKEMNVRYVEPFFDIQAHTRRGVAAEDVLNGYLRAQQDGASQLGVRSNWIFCFLRDEPVADGEEAYRIALPWARGGLGLFHAVGLASNAYERPPNLFHGAFKRARKDDLHVTTHCDFGQKDTHEHIRQAIFDIGVDRIDHGLDAVDSDELIEGLVAKKIGLTLCPHAYHRRTPTRTLFPKLRHLFSRGVQFCINSDDPVYMHDMWISGNMEKTYRYCGFSKAEMIQLTKNSVDMCWAEDQIKIELYAEIEAVARELHQS